MALNITIRYPETSEAISADQIEVLARFEEIIVAKIVTITCSTSNYNLQHVPEHKSDTYFALAKTYDGKILGTYGICWLTKVTPEEFIEKVQLDQVFSVAEQSEQI